MEEVIFFKKDEKEWTRVFVSLFVFVQIVHSFRMGHTVISSVLLHQILLLPENLQWSKCFPRVSGKIE